ncbi:MAG: phosphate-starvation-inducible PsiE family protein [Melioribacteraceae bacterium]|nr:phosphate-starvation-inducible PsiE family protein [Melioribacteraceae bacterium]
MSEPKSNTERLAEDIEPEESEIPKLSRTEQVYLVGSFRIIQRLLLVLTGLMTLIAAGMEVFKIYDIGVVALADILLMFLYTEVIAMVAVFYTGRGSPFIYPIFIAITALARLIVLQGKDMDPQNILYEAGSIVLLAIAAVIILRAPRYS